jgi:hypothetical protein
MESMVILYASQSFFKETRLVTDKINQSSLPKAEVNYVTYLFSAEEGSQCG